MFCATFVVLFYTSVSYAVDV